MTIKRIASLGTLPEEPFLKPVSLTFKEARAAARNPDKLIFYFKRRNPKFPALMFEEVKPAKAEVAPVAMVTLKAEEAVPAVQTLNAGLKQLDLFAEGMKWNQPTESALG